MTTQTFNTSAELAQVFNSNFQPRHIKSINGLNVNNRIEAGMENINTLKVSRKHVTLENYIVKDQSLKLTFLSAPFIITF